MLNKQRPLNNDTVVIELSLSPIWQQAYRHSNDATHAVTIKVTRLVKKGYLDIEQMPRERIRRVSSSITMEVPDKFTKY